MVRLEEQLKRETQVHEQILKAREREEQELRTMINMETDKRMEAVREAATVTARGKDNEERIKRLEREVEKQ